MTDEQETLIPPTNPQELLEWQTKVKKPRTRFSNETSLMFWDVIKKALKLRVWRDGIADFSQVLIEIGDGIGLRIQGPTAKTKLLVDVVPFDFGKNEDWETRALNTAKMMEVLDFHEDEQGKGFGVESIIDAISPDAKKSGSGDDEKESSPVTFNPVDDDWGEDIFALDDGDDEAEEGEEPTGHPENEAPAGHTSDSFAAASESDDDDDLFSIDEASEDEPDAAGTFASKAAPYVDENAEFDEEPEAAGKVKSPKVQSALSILKSRKELKGVPQDVLKAISDWLTNGDHNNPHYVAKQLEKTTFTVKTEPAFQMAGTECALITLYALNENNREYQQMIGNFNVQTVATSKTEFGSQSKTETMLVSKVNPAQKAYIVLYHGKPDAQAFRILTF